jgi:hypothetical protein
MGKRARRRGAVEKLTAPTTDHTSPDGDVLTLRGVLSPSARSEYAATLKGNVLSQEDAWQRATELLFERLAVRWEISGVATEGQKHLLMRYRVGSPDERKFVRDALRAHLADHFPELTPP